MSGGSGVGLTRWCPPYLLPSLSAPTPPSPDFPLQYPCGKFEPIIRLGVGYAMGSPWGCDVMRRVTHGHLSTCLVAGGGQWEVVELVELQRQKINQLMT